MSGQEALSLFRERLLPAEAPVPQRQAAHGLVAGSQPCGLHYRDPSVHGTRWELGGKGRSSALGREADFDFPFFDTVSFSLLAFPFASFGLFLPLILIVSG